MRALSGAWGCLLNRGELFAVILALVLPAAQAATYYVDSSVGNDKNTGSTTNSPWKNCPGMTAYAGSGNLKPGDTVYFARGGTWLVSGGQGLYLTGGVTYVGNSWGDGNMAVIRAASDCDAGVVRFRDDPAHETVFQGFEVDANHTVSTGIDINHRYWTLMNGAIKRVKECVVHNTWSTASSNQYKYGVIISNHGGTGGYCENVEVIDTTVHDTSRDAICLYPGDENAGCRIKNITVQGCEAYNTGLDPTYGAGSGILVKGYVQDVWIDHCYSHGTLGAAMFLNGNESNHYPGVGPTNINISYSIFTCSNANGGIRIYDGSSGKDPKTVNVYGNVVYNSTATGGFYVDRDLGNTNSIRIYNNTFYNSPVYINGLNAVFSTLEFKNNIIYYTGGIPLTDAKGQITSHSNNLYFGNGTLVSANGKNYTSSNLKGNYESTGTAADPLFKNRSSLPTGFTGTFGVDLSPNSDGLSLQPNSIALSNGIVLLSPFNGSINSVTRPVARGWEMGAYQTAAGIIIVPTTLAQAQWQSGGIFGFQLSGQFGQSYTVQSSADLTHWTLLTNGVLGLVPATVSDPAASNTSFRFYRVFSP